MAAAHEDLPEDIEALKAALIAERAKRIEEATRAARVEAELAVAKAKTSDDAAVIGWVIKSVRDELDAFREWEAGVTD